MEDNIKDFIIKFNIEDKKENYILIESHYNLFLDLFKITPEIYV